MLAVVDLGAIYWPCFFATKSGTRAYELTMDELLESRRGFERLAVCADHPQLLRKDWCPSYKSNREEKPRDAVDGLKAVEDRVQSWGVPLIKKLGYEGDDIVASLVKQAWEEVIIIAGSGDKDLMALLSDSVKMQTRKAVLGPEDVVAKYGVEPRQMRDWIAMAGDSVDGIQGCDHMGPGRAALILQHYGDLETAQRVAKERPAEFLKLRGIGQKTMFAFQEWDPAMAVKLATLLTDAPVDLESLWDEEDANEDAYQQAEDDFPF